MSDKIYVGGPIDPSGEPLIWLNYYSHDECGTEWQDEWSCQCNNKCPECGAAIGPYKSEEINQEFFVSVDRSKGLTKTNKIEKPKEKSFEKYLDDQGDLILDSTQDYHGPTLCVAITEWLISNEKKEAAKRHN